MKIFDELLGRGLVRQCTDMDKVRALLDGDKPVTFYIGFDPTADSLHVGHLLQVVTARRLMAMGHRPILLIGGATALIGDPTGKTDMRKMQSRMDITGNSIMIGRQFIKLMGVGARIAGQDHPFLALNNLSWFDGMNFLQFLRDVGPHFSVNNMLRAECFKSRMEHGLSFLEFNYMVMQAQDFFHLHQQEGCVLQIGGDDQWSNMLAGIDLIHKKTGQEAFALTLPLLTNSDGTKMGKTEKGAVWLSEEGPTSIFDFFQFWRNIPDTEVIKCFKQLTLLSLEAIAAIPFESAADINAAKKRLAFELTKLVHGDTAAQVTLETAEALFESRDVSVMEPLPIADNIHVLDLLKECGFAKSRTDARNLINNRGISINEEVWTDPTAVMTSARFGPSLVVRKGKKHFRLLHFTKVQNVTT